MKKWYRLELHTKMYAVASVLFVVGSITGAVIYSFSVPASDVSNFQVIGGQAYATDPTDSKSYDDQLERIGGRSAVFADRFNRWLGSLWHGERLGITVLVLCTGCASILFLIARRVERDHADRIRGSPK